MREIALMTLPPLSWLLFSLGGYKWKGYRRFVLPLVYALFCLLASVVIWKAVFVALFACFVFHLGYGESSSWLKRGLIGVGFAYISGILGYTPWQIVIPVVWLFMFWMSNSKITWLKNMFTHKIVEGVTGALIGLSIAIQL